MNFGKIITWILILFVVLLIIISFFGEENTDLSKVDLNSDYLINIDINNIKEKPSIIYGDLKNKIVYGSKDRIIDSEVYFCPEDNCEVELINLINSSKESIDCAIYDISLDAVSSSLIDKKKEGLEVRIVTDYLRSSTKTSKIGDLKANNIFVISNPSSSSYMHNKFCVFDNKKIFIGSMNFTLNGVYKNNNNILILEDKELALFFKKKIDSFFDGNFSLDLKNNYYINQFGNIETYFCPEEDCYSHFLEKLEVANSIDCMFFSFTIDEVTDIISSKEIPSRFILESRTIDNYSEFDRLIDKNIFTIKDKNPESMHNKFCIFDNSFVMTGSMNLSNNGISNNDESIIFIYDENITKEYINYFNKYWDLWNK
ncbi:MAG: phospholipase D-like domain-containing protein [Candidatus ainarchaeum sp.]|nr:phospholipase D-like domain-containing protein [Candidatus ainarchaeum sp.]